MPGVLAALAELRRSSSETATATRIAVTDRGRTLLVDTDTIDWVEADDDYVRLHVGARNHLVRDTMAAVAERLPPGLVRLGDILEKGDGVSHEAVIGGRGHVTRQTRLQRDQVLVGLAVLAFDFLVARLLHAL